MSNVLVRHSRLLSPIEAKRGSMRLLAASPVPAELQAELESMPTMRQIALMQMSQSIVKNQIIARLREDTQDGTGFTDYAALRERGWAERKPEARWHTLTHDGLNAAAHLEKMLCNKLGIHLLFESGGDRFNIGFRCPCGWHANIARGRATASNAARAFSRHIDSIEGVSRLVTVLTPPHMKAPSIAPEQDADAEAERGHIE